MDKYRLEQLLQQHANGSLTPSEQAELDKWYLAEAEAASPLTDAERFSSLLEQMDRAFPFVQEQHVKKVTLWPRVVAAASILLVIAVGLYFYRSNRVEKNNKALVYANDIAPGKTKATLTLANGKKIILSDIGNGKVAEEAGVLIRKTADGKLIYEIKDQGETNTDRTNTISTSNGETYDVILPEGSLVVLNAASSLTYSTSLNKLKVRNVKLQGEAYFEVAKDKTRPFIITSAQQTVEVLGTHFNINAYADEPNTRTTLVEGSVKVTANNNAQVVIKPGEQAMLKNDKIEVNVVNVNAAIDWKEGKFRFKNESLPSILRKVSRWYDVKIIYLSNQENLPTFSGTVSRFDHVSSVLRMLEETGDVKFEIEGRTIKVK